MAPSRTLRAVATLGCYGVLVVWLTWPLGAHLGTHLPNTVFICDIDLRQMIWALSWQSHALLTAPSRFFEANIYHPTAHALLYADAGLGALPYFLPVFWVTGNPVLASNLLFLGGVVLTACALHLLVAHWTGLASAGVVAAGTFLATRWVLWAWIPAVPNYAVLYLLPAIVYLGALDAPSSRQTGLLALLLVLHGATNPYYAASALMSIGVLACARMRSRATRRPAFRLLAAATIAGVVLAVVYAPWAWLRALEPGLADQTPWRFDRLLPRLSSMHIPRDLFGDQRKPLAVPPALLALVAVGAIARAVPRAGRTDGERTAWRHGPAWAAIGIALSLMPTINVLGWTVHLPGVDLVDRLPLVGTLRDPYRIGVGALFGMAILAGAAFAECVRWVERSLRLRRPGALRLVAAAVLLVVSAGVLRRGRVGAMPGRVPYPIAAASIGESPIMAELRKPGGPVLQLPIPAFLVSELTAQAHAMFESIGHWRPLLNGYGGYYPKAFVERMRLARRLPDVGALFELVRETGLAYVLVRGAVPPTESPTEPSRWEELARRGGGEGLLFVMRNGADMLFAVAYTFEPVASRADPPLVADAGDR